ncbi:MAG TPA: hypothetical protein VIG33_17560 [Pseudobdellovibrionaceae bacterium]|jgi:hypothetical protein
MTETLIYGFLFVLGFCLIIFRPIERSIGVSPYWEIGFGSLLVIFFAIFITSSFILEPMFEEDLAKKPCGGSSPQGNCYSLEHSLCETAWQGAESQCKAEMDLILKARPSALIGPTMNRCRAKRMDQALRFNRINTHTSYCKAYFEYIDRK